MVGVLIWRESNLVARVDATDTHRMWTRTDSGSFVPTPAVANGKVYVLRDRGEVHCIDPKTGKSHWEDAFPRASSSYYGSPTIAGGKLYAPREDGVILVADVTDGFKFLAENDMGERVIASPVPSRGGFLSAGKETCSASVAEVQKQRECQGLALETSAPFARLSGRTSRCADKVCTR